MNDKESIERLVRIETNVESLVLELKRIAGQQATELRGLSERVRALEHSNERMQAIVKLVAWMGAPGTAAVVLFIASKWN